MMKKLVKTMPILIAITILSIYSCEKDEDPMPVAFYSDIMANQVKTNLVDDASISPYEAIFDVSPYFTQGHLPFATNTDGADGLKNILNALDKNKTYLVYCHADAPSIVGVELLIENGFSNVYRLKGNYSAWDEVSFIDIAASEVKIKIDAGDFEAIFDVSPHHREGHLPGATNANATAGGTSLSELIGSMDKNKTYLVYCHIDGPSFSGAQLMEDTGFQNVYRLEGNYGAWVDTGYEVEN